MHPRALDLTRNDDDKLPSFDPPSSAMLQELTHMDRITQLQDEIQQVRAATSFTGTRADTDVQLLTIMSSSIAYLTSRANFVQVSPEVPVTKARPPEKYDSPEVFDGALLARGWCFSKRWTRLTRARGQRIRGNSWRI